MAEEEAAAAQGNGAIKHYEHVSQLPEHLKKYWAQRYGIFSKFDDGIWLTDDAWFGVTPEPIANKIAQHIAETAPASKTVIVDAFAGAGGNAIAFALSGRWEQIFAIEKDPEVLKCAKHNAEVYGVQSKIWFIEGDCFKVIKERLKALGQKAVLFASPPWGGPDYSSEDVFDLDAMKPYSLADLYVPFTKFTTETVLYLPRSSNLNQLARYVPKDQKVEVIHYCMYAASKALCIYYGNFTFAKLEEARGSGERSG